MDYRVDKNGILKRELTQPKLMLTYHGSPILFPSFEKVFTTSDIELSRKDECINFLKNIREMLRIFLEKGKYPNQDFNITCCIDNINILIDVIELKY